MDRRIEARLPVRRLNVLIAGAVLSTVDVSNKGARVHCAASQYSLVERLLSDPVEIVIELPIGREVTAFATVSHIHKANDDVFLGFAFESFKYKDEQGWRAFIAAKQREYEESSQHPSYRQKVRTG